MKKIIVVTFMLIFSLCLTGPYKVTAADVSYVYDDLHRLTDIIYWGSSAVSYSYDAVGNRVIETTDAEPRHLAIQSAICRGRVVTVRGNGFSHYIDDPDSSTGISAVDRYGNPLDCQIRSWDDTMISTTCSACPSTVTVTSVWGNATKRPRVPRTR